jgi:leader peptidase (prepilin peptidase) / N-methyltransferase
VSDAPAAAPDAAPAAGATEAQAKAPRSPLAFAPGTPLGWLVPAALLGAAAGGSAGVLLHGPVAAAVTALAFALLAGVSVIDYCERRIPNALIYPATLLALAGALLLGREAMTQALGGLLLAGGIFFVFWLIGRGQLGLGDVKLSGFVGALLGASGVPLYLVAGVTAGAVGAIVLLLAGRGRRSTMPYGPFLAFGAALSLLVEGPIIS